MFAARSSIARGLPRCSARVIPSAQRGMAAAAGANPFHFTVGNANGVKVAARDDGRPTTSLAVVVRGGSRYETAPGLAHGLANFAFKNTKRRSALRLCREVELLGGKLSTSVSRENIVLGAKFLRDDLPYFVEAMGDVLTRTKFNPYEYAEEVGPVLVHELEVFNRTPAEIALETAHNVAFHTGLGGHRLAITPKYVGKVGQATYGNVETAGGVPSVTVMHSEHTIPGYAQKVYQKGNIAVVASGAEIAELEKWTKEFFAELPSGEGLSSLPSKYYGGENRVYCPYGDAIVIAYPGTHGAPGNKPELTVLSYLLGGEAGTKWNAGTSALSQAVADLTGVKAVSRHHAYSDAGLLAITITGPQDQLKQAGTNVVKAIDSIASSKPEDVKRAIAQAKFDVLAAAEDRTKGLELIGQSVIASGKAPQVEDVVKALEGVTVESVKKTAQEVLGGRATMSVAGDLHFLPFASEIGLKC